MAPIKKIKTVHPCPKFIAIQIKSWRKRRALTQKDVANEAGIKFRHFQEIESGRVDIKIRTLGLISNVLDVTPHLLLKPLEENRKSMCDVCKNMK